MPLPVQRLFTYGVPSSLPLPERGARVVVPFGRRRMMGVALGTPTARPEGEEARALKDVIEVVDETALLSAPLLELAAWMAEYYLAPPGLCYRLLLPAAGMSASRTMVRRAERGEDGESEPVLAALGSGPLPLSTLAHRLGRDPASQVARLRRAGSLHVEQELETPGFRRLRMAVLTSGTATADPRASGQAEVLDRLRQAGGRLAVPELVRDRPSLRGALKRLVERGLVGIVEERVLRETETLPGGSSVRPRPTPDQARVLERLLDARAVGFRPFLLHGITGSGKTEVYFRAAEQALAGGGGVLVLVPEIALTPLLARAVAARFGRTVCVLHSGLSAGERHDQWWRIREGDARVVVGARSAVFAPLQRLGLVVVDEEHEAAYKQEDSPRYHARDVAVMRAKLEQAAVVLGSATPSVESYTNARRGKYELLELPERIGPRGLPVVEVVDRRQAMRSGADPVLTVPLREALTACLDRGEQALLLLNRRGWATSLLCRECGQEAACPNCSVSLVLHDGGRRAQCHYCGHNQVAPERCRSCRGVYLRFRGYGTEKVVEAVREALPRARVDRLDRDRASRRGAAGRVLAAFEKGELDVLVGTQMIAKGHDFPRVTLVGVIDADVGLGLPDFRAAERTFQLLTQMAGRAGRGEQKGEVVLQSHLPEHYALRLAGTHDYAAFFEREMEFRATMAYPPAAALANVVLRAPEEAGARGEADWLAGRLRESAAGRYRVLGPASAPLSRLKGQHRVQVLLKGNRQAIRAAVRTALSERYGETRWTGVAVDIDPVSLM